MISRVLAMGLTFKPSGHRLISTAGARVTNEIVVDRRYAATISSDVRPPLRPDRDSQGGAALAAPSTR
jgi:hypothetical protein